MGARPAFAKISMGWASVESKNWRKTSAAGVQPIRGKGAGSEWWVQIMSRRALLVRTSVSLKDYEQKGSTIRFIFEQNYWSVVLRIDFKGQRLKQGEQLGYCYSTVNTVLQLELYLLTLPYRCFHVSIQNCTLFLLSATGYSTEQMILL